MVGGVGACRNLRGDLRPCAGPRLRQGRLPLDRGRGRPFAGRSPSHLYHQRRLLPSPRHLVVRDRSRRLGTRSARLCLHQPAAAGRGCRAALSARDAPVASGTRGALRRCGLGVQFPRHQHGVAVDERPHGIAAVPVRAGERACALARASSRGGRPDAGRAALQGRSDHAAPATGRARPLASA